MHYIMFANWPLNLMLNEVKNHHLAKTYCKIPDIINGNNFQGTKAKILDYSLLILNFIDKIKMQAA